MSKTKFRYHKIQNFRKNGILGINTEVIKEITRQAVIEVEGADLYQPKKIFTNYPIDLKMNSRGLFLTVCIKVINSDKIDKIATLVQEKIERNIMYMTEINPKKIDVIIEEVVKA